MIELLVVLLILYALTVLVSWGMIKLIFDDIPAKVALIPVLNLIVPFIDRERGRIMRQTGRPAVRTPQQELERERYRHPGPFPWSR